mgnify:CR=1 FL=1
MIAYKAFDKGLNCRGYQFEMGLNVTEKAKTAAYGFHCAEDPLDCLSYYGNMNFSKKWLSKIPVEILSREVSNGVSRVKLNI